MKRLLLFIFTGTLAFGALFLHLIDRSTAAIQDQSRHTPEGTYAENSVTVDKPAVTSSSIKTGSFQQPYLERTRNATPVDKNNSNEKTGNSPQSTPVEHPLSKLIESLSAIDELDGVMLPNSTDEFLSQLESSPYLIERLVDNLSKLSAPSEIEHLIALLATVESESLEKHVIETLKISNERVTRTQLFSLLANRGVESQEGVEFMLTALPKLRSDMNVESALTSLSPIQTSEVMAQEVMTSLVEYANSDTSTVRQAAVEKIVSWSGTDEKELLIKALVDPSQDVRRSVLFALGQIDSIAPEIKDSLVTLMSNETELHGLRIQAHEVLSNYELTGEDYEKYFQFNSNLDANPGGMPSG